MCGRAVYSVVGRCTVRYVGVMFVRVLYCVVWGVVYGMTLYCVLVCCTVR